MTNNPRRLGQRQRERYKKKSALMASAQAHAPEPMSPAKIDVPKPMAEINELQFVSAPEPDIPTTPAEMIGKQVEKVFFVDGTDGKRRKYVGHVAAYDEETEYAIPTCLRSRACCMSQVAGCRLHMLHNACLMLLVACCMLLVACYMLGDIVCVSCMSDAACCMLHVPQDVCPQVVPYQVRR